MSTWEDLKSNFRVAANKVVCFTDELAEEAALAVRKKTAEAHLSEAYEALGRISYRLFWEKCSDPASDEQFQQAFREASRCKAELDAISAEIARTKNAKSDEKQKHFSEEKNQANEDKGDSDADNS